MRVHKIDTKSSDSAGFCGFQKMLMGVDFQSLRLCAFVLSFYSLTQRRRGAETQRYDVGTRDYYARAGYCHRPQNPSESEKFETLRFHFSSALARRFAQHWMFTATGSDAVWQCAYSMCTASAVTSPPSPIVPIPSELMSLRSSRSKSSIS